MRVETAEGKQEYAAAQRGFAERGAPLRERLVGRVRAPPRGRRMRRWVPVLVVVGWLGMAPGVVVSLRAREDSDAQLEMSWLVWVGYLVAMAVGAAWWRLRDREVAGGRQRGAAALAVLVGVSVPVAVYVVGVFVSADPRPANVVVVRASSRSSSSRSPVSSSRCSGRSSGAC